MAQPISDDEGKGDRKDRRSHKEKEAAALVKAETNGTAPTATNPEESEAMDIDEPSTATGLAHWTQSTFPIPALPPSEPVVPAAPAAAPASVTAAAEEGQEATAANILGASEAISSQAAVSMETAPASATSA